MSSNARLSRVTLLGRNFITIGLPRRPWQDLYHLLMTAGWPSIFGGFACFFVLFNLVFAMAYALQPGDLANLNPPNYWGDFFFSVETLATVGYGDMHPQTPYAHVIAALEIFTGLMSLALMTGMMFARFSRPTARFLFARHAVIRPFDGKTTLMLRAANARQSIVMEASAQLRLIKDEKTIEGYSIRRIYDLPLRRNQQPTFLFGWNILHVIDESSPLARATNDSLAAANASLLLTLSGTDETTGQILMARHQYQAASLRWNHTFVDILTVSEHGIDRFDYTKFHDVVPLAPDAS